MVLKQGQHQHGMLQGKEPSGTHTGAAGEDIFKWAQGAKFKMHGTAPCLKPLLQEQRASFTLLLCLYLKIAHSLSTSFFLNPNLMSSQYAYWEKRRTENHTSTTFFCFFAQVYLFLLKNEGTMKKRIKANAGRFCMIHCIKHSQACFNRACNVLDPSFSNLF